MKRRDSLIFLMNRDAARSEIGGRTEIASTFVPYAGDQIIRLPSRRAPTFRPAIPFTLSPKRRRRRA